MPTAVATGIKDFSISEDGKEATFTLITKHSGDIGVRLPTECLGELQAPSLNATAGREAVPGDKADARGKTPGSPVVSVPKKWAAGVDAKRGVVVVIFDHGSPAQFGFALGHGAAKELAGALVKQADVVAAGATTKQA